MRFSNLQGLNFAIAKQARQGNGNNTNSLHQKTSGKYWVVILKMPNAGIKIALLCQVT
jgi:hypothetical protein